MLNEYTRKRKFFSSKTIGAQGIYSLVRPFFSAGIVTLIIKIRKKKFFTPFFEVKYRTKEVNKMENPKIELTLSNGDNVTLYNTDWSQFTEELQNENIYIERHMLEDDGSVDTYLVIKNQIVLAELSYEQMYED